MVSGCGEGGAPSAAQASAARVGVERQGLLRSGHPSVGETGLGTARLRQGQPASTHDSPSHAPDLVAPMRTREASGTSPPHVFSSRGIDDAGRVRLLFPRAPPPSSSGLGYQVLILKTGVRLPLGVFASIRLRPWQAALWVDEEFRCYPLLAKAVDGDASRGVVATLGGHRKKDDKTFPTPCPAPCGVIFRPRAFPFPRRSARCLTHSRRNGPGRSRCPVGQPSRRR